MNPQKTIFLPVKTDDATSVVAATVLVMVVSAGKKADLQRVGMLSSLKEISMRVEPVVKQLTQSTEEDLENGQICAAELASR